MISVPFMEPLPLYRGHHSRFLPERIESLFPDAEYTVFDKSKRADEKPLAWIMCEISKR
jgi:hypothetical protein